MVESDFDAFQTMLDSVCTLISRGRYVPDEMSTAMFWRALQPHPIGVVRAAFDAHVRDTDRGTFVPVPADILRHIVGAAVDDGRPSGDEAWAVALPSADERETVVWSTETAAAFAIARPVLAAGDEVGARMAFRQAYERLVDQARRAGVPATWVASLGADPELRHLALAAAARAGRLTGTEHDRLALTPPPAVALLSAPEVLEEAPPEAIAALRALAGRLRLGVQERESADALARADTQRRKENAARAAAGWVSPAELMATVESSRTGASS